jgi:NAD(P)-dependent dehydrogenase (short-subunit alcohol dehydrogenase family)
MNLKLTGKTALVSGSTKGIGFAIATGLAREGARVIVNGRSEKAVVEAKAQIKQTVPDAGIEGFAAVVFDYRQWGGSSGQPREELSFPRQLENLRVR